MTVYIVQRQMKFSHEEGSMKPRFETIEKAREYGEIKELLPSNSHPYKPEVILEKLSKIIPNMTSDDWVVPVGNPTLVGLAVSMIADHFDGKIKMLHWSNRDEKYVPIEVDVFR